MANHLVEAIAVRILTTIPVGTDRPRSPHHGRILSRFRLSPLALSLPGLALLLLLPIAVAAQDRTLRVIGDENYPPYLFLDANGQEHGYLVDLWKLWGRKTGILVELKATKWEEAQRILLRGDADVIENIFETPQRQPLYDFSKPYADLPVNIYRDVSIGGLATLSSLRGFRVGVMEGDACIERLKANGVDTLVYYDNYSKLIQAAQAQDIKVFCLDEYPANFYLYQLGADRQFVKAFELYRGQFHRAVRKGNLATLRLVEQGMAAISAAEMDALRRKWLSEPTDYRQYADYAVEAAAGLALVLALLGFWVYSLRRAVAARLVERARAEQALFDRDLQLRSIGDNLPNGFIYQFEVVSGQPRFRYISAGVHDTLGFTPEQLTADAAPLFALIPRQSLADYAAEEAKSAATLSNYTGTLPFDLPDGRRRWLLVKSRPRRTADGGVLWDGIALDMTDQRLAEERLVASEQRFRRLFEDSREAITLVENGYFIDANRASLAMLRVDSLERLRGLRPADLSPERQPDGQLSAIKEQEMIRVAFETGSNQFEWEHVRTNGEHFFAEVLVTPMTFGERRLLHVVWRDITEKKRVEAELDRYRQELESLVSQRTAALQASNEQLAHTQFAMDRAGIGITWNSVETGRFLYANDEICRQLGYTREDLLRLGVSDINLEFPPQALQQVASELRSTGESLRLETTHQRKDGSTYPVAVTVYLHHAAGEEWLIAFFEDITARKAAQAELVIARDAAEAADRAKSVFLANMSHEIRTPMNAIIGMAHLALKTELTPRQRDYLEKIRVSGQHLLGIINDILDFSKIDAGKLVVERIDFDLEKVLDNVTALVAERAAIKGLELIVSFDPQVPMRLVGDPLRIGQVLINFVNNAVKFTERGEISIRVATVSQTDREIVLRFSVRDSGIGIAADQLPRLFQSFQQADASTTRKFGGTGLGLAIAKRLAALMGGEVGVESSPGTGSTFWFTVRVSKSRKTTAPLLPKPDLRGRNVLLVDDNAHAREVIGEMLQGMTFEVLAVDSGAAALEELDRAAAAGRPYEVVLLDWQMPDMDGIATARAIRQRARPNPPLLLMVTAYDRDELLHAAEGLGISDCLTKPVTPSSLFDALMQQFGLAPGARHPMPAATANATWTIDALVGKRVLLVEDNELNTEVATELLREVGLRVDLAPDGAVAVDKVRHNVYDLVLMDMQMPVMDGLTATREIRQLPDLQHLPILAMTANVMASDREQCLAAGMNDHIAKPIDPHELIEKLLRWTRPLAQDTQDGPAPTPIEFSADQSSTPPPVQELAQQLEGIAGLDPAAGLRQAMGRDTLYRRLLLTFVTDQAATPGRLATALAAGDWTDAQRLAHTLKGVAAQIGAKGLSALAEQLEQAIQHRAPETRLADLRDAIAGPLNSLIETITARLAPSAPPDQATSSSDPAQAIPICNRLREMLRHDDFACERLLDENEAVLRTALGDRFTHIAEAIQQYDYAAALDELTASPLLAQEQDA